MSEIITSESTIRGRRFFEKYDLGLYYEIVKARYPDPHEPQPNHVKLDKHPLIGKQLVKNQTGKKYNIQGVWKSWYGGWYLQLLIEHDGSHCGIAWQSIDCIDPSILETIINVKLEFHLLEEDEAEVSLEEWLMKNEPEIYEELGEAGVLLGFFLPIGLLIVGLFFVWNRPSRRE